MEKGIVRGRPNACEKRMLRGFVYHRSVPIVSMNLKFRGFADIISVFLGAILYGWGWHLGVASGCFGWQEGWEEWIGVGYIVIP